MTVTTTGLDLKTNIDQLVTDPAALAKLSLDELFALDATTVDQFQLATLQRRFAQFRNNIQALTKLADEQDVTEIHDINDIAPLLFQHTAYKSYPLALIEKNRFDKMTQWLQKLTTHDLSHIDTSGVKSIDDWLGVIEDNTTIQIVHSSGTTGKLSFLPRSEAEIDAYKDGLYKLIEGCTGIDFHTTHMPVFFPGFRDGRQLQQRVIGGFGPIMAGGAEHFHTAMDGFMSADFMSLAGRVKAAQAKGELGKLQMIKALAYNKGELIKMKRNQPKQMKAFMEKLLTAYPNQPILFMGVWPFIIEAALSGLENGVKNVLAPGSGIVTGGGLKGYNPPEGWYEKCLEFFGLDFIGDSYGMTEMTGGGCIPCKNNHYHLPAWFVPYMLDPETGEVLPRQGSYQGRLAFYDLLTESYWGGFITGDEVTIHWDDSPCGCGWKGIWFEPGIRRYSEKSGGTDKISCAGTGAAYDSFLDFLLEEEEI